MTLERINALFIVVDAPACSRTKNYPFRQCRFIKYTNVVTSFPCNGNSNHFYSCQKAFPFYLGPKSLKFKLL